MDVLFGDMQPIGLPGWRLIAGRARPACWAAGGAIAACALACWMWGFTVDDALISVRYARNLVVGAGWRFNAIGASTDGVTPLPWPVVLAPLARADACAVLGRAKVLGFLAWVVTGGMLGWRVGRSPSPAWARAGALIVLGLSVPPAAYAVSGMETALPTGFATWAALSLEYPLRAALLAGLAASFRPELAVWAVVLGAGAALGRGRSASQVSGAVVLSILPFAACASIRFLAWGRPTPLAIFAKPSDLPHGLSYVAAACVVTLTPLLVLAPVSLGRARAATAIVVAAGAHVVTVALVGGDWMPYARLMVPVAPSLALAAVLLGEKARPAATAIRTALAIALGLALLPRARAGRTVGAERAALVAKARPVLAGIGRVAALDIGWVSAATDADIVDLGGLTDPSIAYLPGGMTSKRVDAVMLLSRRPDVLLLYASHGLPDGGLPAWQAASFSRSVEARLARDEILARHFTPAAWLPLGSQGAGYVVLRATPVE